MGEFVISFFVVFSGYVNFFLLWQVMCITWHGYEDASKAHRKYDNILHLDSWKCKNDLERKHMHLHMYSKTCLHSIYWNRRKESKSNRKFHVNPKTIANLNQVFLLSIEYTIVHHKKVDGTSEFPNIFDYSIFVRGG